MIRVLFALTAVLVVALAFVLDQPWLYGAAAVFLLGTLGYLVRHFWLAYRQESTAGTSEPPPPRDSLQNLGIMDVRTQDALDGADDSSPAREAEPPSSTGAGPSPVADGASEPDDLPPERDTAGRDTAPSAAVGPDRWADDEHPVLGPCLESLRAATGGQSACLLVQEEVALEYTIEALASVQPDVRRTGSFETQEPLLTATMSRQSVTVRSLDDDERRVLGYYDTVPAISQVALAPVSRPDTPATVFLLVDATAEVDLGTPHVRSMLEHYAETAALLLDADEPVPEPAAAPTGASDTVVEGSEPMAEPAPGSRADAESPRPRREIIAEEMQAADVASDDLALVLVHLNRAESIARRGEEAVAAAEQHLRSRLENLAPGQRVERFGELTYGLFVRRDVDAVEGWAADLQDAFAQETGRLEGGVSVGAAVRGGHHDPEALRADATDALLEAYETGTCTIVA